MHLISCSSKTHLEFTLHYLFSVYEKILFANIFFCDETLQVQTLCILFVRKVQGKRLFVLLDVSITFPNYAILREKAKDINLYS